MQTQINRKNIIIEREKTEHSRGGEGRRRGEDQDGTRRATGDEEGADTDDGGDGDGKVAHTRFCVGRCALCLKASCSPSTAAVLQKRPDKGTGMREARGPRAGPTVSSSTAINRRLRTPSATLLRRRTLCCLREAAARTNERRERERENSREKPESRTISRPVIVPRPQPPRARRAPLSRIADETRNRFGPIVPRNYGGREFRHDISLDSTPRRDREFEVTDAGRVVASGSPERNIIRIFIENGRIRGILPFNANIPHPTLRSRFIVRASKRMNR